MPKVTFANEHLTVDVERGRTLKQVADENGINLFEGFWKSYHCDGKGLCLGKGCRVWVLQRSPDAVSPMTWKERIRPALKGAMRMACQVRVQGDVEVRTQPGASLDNEPNMTWDPDPAPSAWRDRLKEAGKPKKKAPPPAKKPAAAAPAAAAKPAAAPVPAEDEPEPDQAS